MKGGDYCKVCIQFAGEEGGSLGWVTWREFWVVSTALCLDSDEDAQGLVLIFVMFL
jgi:hypothetical protein